MNRLTILGAGSWGTALGIVLAPKFSTIRLLVHEPDLAERMARSRENDVYLPGYRLPENLVIAAGLDLGSPDLLLGVMPSQYARGIYSKIQPNCPIVSATKGIENQKLQTISQVISEIHPDLPVAALSGPTFAKEIARGAPAAVVIASRDVAFAQTVQQEFSRPSFRLYTNPDIIGVEVGAALKNVIAIAAGVVAGLDLGHNALAALITRGLAEITRLAVAAGGEAKTLAGLAGLGDLVLTATGDLSRNRRVGVELARGKPLTEIVAATKMVAEGVETTMAAMKLAERLGVEMPITAQMADMLGGRTTPAAAIRALMERAPKPE
ncbi:MAG: NAD(P)H-dependent glycerol-3-phosphate dehydrogenase [Bryobacteraceae bacterium]|nr:NAD(P)H-dependent glycerol-3-phosphate dehydrogenase [Bryobacteraceae bacterium]